MYMAERYLDNVLIDEAELIFYFFMLIRHAN